MENQGTITVTIMHTRTVEKVSQQSVLKSEVPTERMERTAGGGERAAIEKNYDVVDVKQQVDVETLLLKQNLRAEAFDMAAVIRAVNGLAQPTS